LNFKNFVKGALWRVLKLRVFSRFQHRILHTNSFLLEGKTKDNLNLSLLVFCDYENVVNYISKFAFSEEPKTENLGRVTYHNMLSLVNRIKPDLVFGEFPGVIRSLISQSFLVLPRVNFFLDISLPMEQILGNMITLRRRSIRKIEASSFVYEATKDPEKLTQFYQEIYLPLVSKTEHSSLSRFTPFEVMKKWFLRGELLLVRQNDAYLAGLLYHPERGDTVHCRVIAYTEGLAAQAALYHLIQTSKRDGYTTLNYGPASPFMNDGLFFYKKSLGMRTGVGNFDSFFGVKICSFERSTRDFLVSNPFIFSTSKGMMGLVTLLKPLEEVNLSSVCHNHYVRGLNKLMIVYPQMEKDKPRFSSPTVSLKSITGGIDSFMKLVRSANYEIGFSDLEES
jgi:hypothetical protein